MTGAAPVEPCPGPARWVRVPGLERLLVDAARPALRKLGRDVYGAFLPTPRDAMAGAEQFLEDLWRDAPPVVALGYTVATLSVWLSPLFVLGARRGIDGLSLAEQTYVLDSLASSRWYLLRGVTTAARAAALIAILRGPEARRAHLGEADGT